MRRTAAIDRGSRDVMVVDIAKLFPITTRYRRILRRLDPR
jgi:hypothetical protein